MLLGFLLTTVLGGYFGSLFQRRVWNHQHVVQFLAAEHKRTVEIFEEVSRQLDKRLYRLRLLYWSLPDGNSTGTRSDMAEKRLEDYRQVLYEWNDGINRNLALIQQYFGDEERRELDLTIGRQFVALGGIVEGLWNGTRTHDDEQKASFEQQLLELNSQIYYYNIRLLRTVRAGAISTMQVSARRKALATGRPD
ncbi:hypothetical protein JIG36_48335 [Actinoplanes sp. LDG1-06]|uniref:Uncharacterized protein n=1 Tax=Paractinoplanes ovalisporus TaxID=2810368 RepID=A0ABS2ATX9_9ACTN|nr:hypothetical protein [Actinoplanes ovalisporus]MBM2623332.1 hypothetical protein [Actinoplanes ovalisporus]